MKKYGITKKIQLGDSGPDPIIQTGKNKEYKRRDRKRARRENKKEEEFDIDEIWDDMWYN